MHQFTGGVINGYLKMFKKFRDIGVGVKHMEKSGIELGWKDE